MKLVSIHSDGRPHRLWTNVSKTYMRRTYFIPPGSLVMDGLGRQWSSDYPVVSFFWASTSFQVFMLLKPDVTDYYCNVILPPLFGRDVVFVDLELDVVVAGGQAQLVDEEEFLKKSTLYPQMWIRSAEEASKELIQAVERQWGPFHPASAKRWREWTSGRLDQESEC